MNNFSQADNSRNNNNFTACNDIFSIEQDIPCKFGLHINLSQNEQFAKECSEISISSPSITNRYSIQNKQQGAQKRVSGQSILRFFRILQKKVHLLNENKKRISQFQKVFKEKIFHSEFTTNKKVKSKYIFDPKDITYIVFQQCKLLLIFFLLLVVTFSWSFNYSSIFAEDYKIAYVDIILMIDILSRFNVAIIIKGQIIYDRFTIFKKYVSGQFIEDIIFLISLQLIVFSEQTITAIIFYVSGTKILFKIIHRLQELFDLSLITSEIIKLIKLLLLINLLAHFIACVWHYVGQNTTGLHKNWLDQQGIRDEEAYVRYIYSFYWSVVTMVTVGYGDITPVNYVEMIVCIVVVFLSCGVFAFSLNLIGQIVYIVNQHQDKLEKNIRTLNNYFKQHNINEELQNRVKNYLEYKFKQEEKDCLNIFSVLSNLPSHLQHNVISEAYYNILHKVPLLMDNFSTTALQKSSHLLQTLSYSPDDIIINQNLQNESDNALYFIDSGIVQVVEKQSNTILFEFHNGEVLGFFEFFTGSPSKFSVICKTQTRILKLPRSSFISILSGDDFENFHQIKHCYEFNIPIKQITCQICNSDDHWTQDCKLLFYRPDITKFVTRMEKLKQRRTMFERKSKKYQTFPNLCVYCIIIQKTFEKQFEYLQNYQQESNQEQSDEICNLSKTQESNINSALNNTFKFSEQQIAPDLENNPKRIQTHGKIKTLIRESNVNLQLKGSQKEKFLTKQQDAETILEFDKMKEYNRFFPSDNYDNLIRKHNQSIFSKSSQYFPNRKISRAMKYISNF